MRIGVDCHVLAGKFQGSRTYLLNLYQAILALNPPGEYVFLGRWERQEPFGPIAEHVDYLSESRWKRLTYQTEPLVKLYRLDILHSTYISPLFMSCKSLLTIHDALYETHPHFFDKTQVIRNRLLIGRSVRKAVQVHTVSEYSRQILIETYRLPDERVKVIPNGVDLAKFSADNRCMASMRVSAKYQIKDYILSVGRLEPRKNHVGLLRAYAILRERNKDVGPLVIVGQRDFGYNEFFNMLRELKLQDSVRILESIDDDILPDIYSAARLFVYPSFAEGFGIPPLEAMASGVPVISSNTTAIPEVVGNAGILINPNNVEEIYEAMNKLLNDEGLHKNLSLLGRKQAETWSWQNAAKSYLKALNETLMTFGHKGG